MQVELVLFYKVDVMSMSELKTLKDFNAILFEAHLIADGNYDCKVSHQGAIKLDNIAQYNRTLKQEAIKWIKFLRDVDYHSKENEKWAEMFHWEISEFSGACTIIEHFFNLTEDDLK
jgi:hypothetical protein